MDLDDLIKALGACVNADCRNCPLENEELCIDKTRKKAVDALKELKELRSAAKTANTAAETVKCMQEEIDAQAQSIETLHLINAKLKGEVEAYENMLRILAKE